MGKLVKVTLVLFVVLFVAGPVMAQQDQAGRNATNKMIINVYAPCMGYPAKDHYYNNCITNPQTQSLTKNPQALCECMSSQVANYLEQNGSQVFREIYFAQIHDDSVGICAVEGLD